MARMPFTDALKFRQLICLLKEAGHTEAPSFSEALNATENNNGLRAWLEGQTDHRKFEDLLRLHWSAA